MRRVALLLVGVLALGAGGVGVHRAQPDWYVRFSHPLRHEGVIMREATRRGVDPALVAAVIKRESDWVPDARSNQGAIGLMQLLPSTARFIATRSDRPSPPPDGLERPEVSIAYGTWYLGYLEDRFGSRRAALAAYNAGEGNLERWLAEARQAGRSFRIPEDIPLAETRAFVAKVEEARERYASAYRVELSLG